MLDCLQDTTTRNIKIIYTKNPKKYLADLQKKHPNPLVSLGPIRGNIDDKRMLQNRFWQSKLQGDWYKGDILRHLQVYIAQEKSKPEQNVIVWADKDFAAQFDSWKSNDPKAESNKHRAQSLVSQTLTELQAQKPMFSLTYASDNGRVDSLVRQWAANSKVDTYPPYEPTWVLHGGAMLDVGEQMLRSMVDPENPCRVRLWGAQQECSIIDPVCQEIEDRDRG